jgi:hypothetical protein
MGFVTSKNSKSITSLMIKLNDPAANINPIKTRRLATVSIVVAAKIRAYIFFSLKIAIIPNIINSQDIARIT